MCFILSLGRMLGQGHGVPVTLDIHVCLISGPNNDMDVSWDVSFWKRAWNKLNVEVVDHSLTQSWEQGVAISSRVLSVVTVLYYFLRCYFL